MWELENQLKDHGRKVPILACCPCTYMCLPYREPKSASPFPTTYFKKKPTEKTYPKKPTKANSPKWSKNLHPEDPKDPYPMRPKWALFVRDFADRWFSNSLIFKVPLMCLCGPLCPHSGKHEMNV